MIGALSPLLAQLEAAQAPASPDRCCDGPVRDRLDGSTPQLWRNLLNGANSLVRPTFSTLVVGSTTVTTRKVGNHTPGRDCG